MDIKEKSPDEVGAGTKLEDFIQHLSWCNKNPGNQYADGTDCVCGLETVLSGLTSTDED